MQDHYSRSNHLALASSCCWLAIAHGPIRLCRAFWGQYNSTCGRKRCVWGVGQVPQHPGSQTHKFLWVSFNSSICLPLSSFFFSSCQVKFLLLLVCSSCYQSRARRSSSRVSSTVPTPEAIAPNGPQISRTPPRGLRWSWTALGSSPAACVSREILPDSPAPISYSIWTNCFKRC